MAATTPPRRGMVPQTAGQVPGTIEELKAFIEKSGGDADSYSDRELQEMLLQMTGAAGEEGTVTPEEGTYVPSGTARTRRVGIFEDIELEDAIRILMNEGVSFGNIRKTVDQWKREQRETANLEAADEGEEPTAVTDDMVANYQDPTGAELLETIAEGLRGGDPADPMRKITPIISVDRFNKVIRQVNKKQPLEDEEDLRAREDRPNIGTGSGGNTGLPEGPEGFMADLENAAGTAFFGAANLIPGVDITMPTPGWDRTRKGPDNTTKNTQEYLQSFFLDVFREDDEVRNALTDVLLESGNERLIYDLDLDEYVPDDPKRPQFGEGGIEIPWKHPKGEAVTVEEITNALVAKGVLPRNVGREMIDMYRTGRFELAFNDPRRDPTTALSKIEKENHSRSLDRKVKAQEFAQRSVTEPWTLYAADDLAQSLKDDPSVLLRNWNPQNPLLNRAQEDIQRAMTTRYAEFIASGNKYLPTDIVKNDIRYGQPEEELGPLPPGSSLEAYQEKYRGSFAQMPESSLPTISSLNPTEAQLQREASLDQYYARAQELLKEKDPTYSQTIQDALMGWRELSNEDRKQVQFAAYLKGEYGDTEAINPSRGEGIATDPTAVINGDVNDEIGYNEWAVAVQSSAFSMMQGSNPLTPMEVVRRIVDQQKSTYRNVLKKDRDARKAELNARDVTVELTDPNAIAESARSVGQSLMGHYPSDQDYKNIIAIVHSRERENALARARATADEELSQIENNALYNFETLDTLEQDIMGGNVFEDPSGGLNFTDPLALADYGSMLAGTEGRIARMKQREVSVQAEPEIAYNPEVNEIPGFDLMSALQNYYRENYSADIDMNHIEGILSQLDYLLASPVQVST